MSSFHRILIVLFVALFVALFGGDMYASASSADDGAVYGYGKTATVEEISG